MKSDGLIDCLDGSHQRRVAHEGTFCVMLPHKPTGGPGYCVMQTGLLSVPSLAVLRYADGYIPSYLLSNLTDKINNNTRWSKTISKSGSYSASGISALPPVPQMVGSRVIAVLRSSNQSVLPLTGQMETNENSAGVEPGSGGRD